MRSEGTRRVPCGCWWNLSTRHKVWLSASGYTCILGTFSKQVLLTAFPASFIYYSNLGPSCWAGLAPSWNAVSGRPDAVWALCQVRTTDALSLWVGTRLLNSLLPLKGFITHLRSPQNQVTQKGIPNSIKIVYSPHSVPNSGNGKRTVKSPADCEHWELIRPPQSLSPAAATLQSRAQDFQGSIPWGFTDGRVLGQAERREREAQNPHFSVRMFTPLGLPEVSTRALGKHRMDWTTQRSFKTNGNQACFSSTYTNKTYGNQLGVWH